MDVLLGFERSGVVAARTGHRLEYLLEQPVALVLWIGQDARPLGASPVEGQLDLVVGLLARRCRHERDLGVGVEALATVLRSLAS